MNTMTTPTLNLKKYLFLCLAAVSLLAANPVSAGVYDDLLKAIDMNDTNTVTSILDRGMDVNTVDRSGNSLLILAATNGNKTLVEFLLAHRAKLGVRNQVGDTALMVASLKGHLEIVQLLVNAQAEINQTGWTALHYAVFEGQDEIVKFLLQKGADINAKAPNHMTALMLAAKNGNEKVVKTLLSAQADPNLATEAGETALKLAITAKHDEVVKLLRAAGAKDSK